MAKNGVQIASQVPPAQVKGTEPQRVVPFRIATLERTEISVNDTGTISSATQPIDRVLEGTGFMYGVMLRLQTTTSGNSANVAYTEDGPWAALAQVTLADPTGQIVNLTGFNLYIANLAMRNYANRFLDASPEHYSAITGTGGNGGSFQVQLRVPAAINRRSLLGLLGNQDRSVKYQLRTDIAPSNQIYATAPTNPGTYTLSRIYENYSVPAPVGMMGPQQVIPDGFGTLHFLTATISEAQPQPNATVNHYLRRIGNTVRFIALIFRAGGATPRATAQNNVDRIQLKIGDTDIHNEPYWYRRAMMYERYGFEFPNGVLVYDWIHDILPFAGGELGDDWLNTQQVNTAQFLVTYGAGFTAGGTLTFVTSDLALVGQPLGS